MSWIILDRDGVINHDSPDYIKSPEEWHPIDNALEAIALLNQKGYQIAIATNQSGIARGLYDEKMLQAIHHKMLQLLKPLSAHIETIVFCPHQDSDNCDCRKPKPGLLKQIAQKHALDLTNIPFVGDSMRDIQAGIHAGCKPILVLTGNGQETLSQNQQDLGEIKICKNLYDFALSI